MKTQDTPNDPMVMVPNDPHTTAYGRYSLCCVLPVSKKRRENVDGQVTAGANAATDRQRSVLSAVITGALKTERKMEKKTRLLGSVWSQE